MKTTSMFTPYSKSNLYAKLKMLSVIQHIFMIFIHILA